MKKSHYQVPVTTVFKVMAEKNIMSGDPNGQGTLDPWNEEIIN